MEEEQQKIQIEEAKAKRQADEEQTQRKFELQQQQMKYEHEQEMEKIRRNPQNKQAEDVHVNAPVPELPMFNDERDNIDAFLRRFERVAKAMNWDIRNYGIMLGTLLSGKALNVYARLPNSEADDYGKIKNALLKNYNLTEEGFLGKFRKSKPKDDESPEQYITRIGNYCGGWFESAGVSTYEEIKSLIVKEQFLNMCPRNLTTHLKERSFESIPEMCKQAERYLQAHKQKMTDNQRTVDGYNKEDGDSKTEHNQKKDCYNCGKFGHIRAECKNEGGGNQQRCNNCHMYGHLEETCRNKKEVGGMMKMRWVTSNRQHQKEMQYMYNKTAKHHCKDQRDINDVLRPVKGKVNNSIGSTLRDTGCSTICVNKKLVLPQQLTGHRKTCKLMDGTEKSFQTAVVNIDTPYIRGKQMPVLCIDNPEYDIVVGEVKGARCKCNPNSTWKLDS